MVQETPLEGGMQLDPDDQLPSMQSNFDALIKRSLRIWFVRWVIGFAAIWAITAWTGRFAWLWPAGITVACVTLTFTLGAHFIIRRKFRDVERARAELEAELAEIEAQDHNAGSET